MRVAFTLEQCWHRVPGGTAVAALELARALREAPRTRAGRRRGASPRPSARAVAAPDRRFAPAAPPRVALYESWHYLRRPRVEQATGPVDVIHATGIAMPPPYEPDRADGARPRLPRLPGALHPPGPPLLPPRARPRAAAMRRSCSARRSQPSSGAARPASRRIGSATSRSGSAPSARRPEDVARVRHTYGLPGRFVLWTGHASSRGRTSPGLVRAFALSRDRRRPRPRRAAWLERGPRRHCSAGSPRSPRPGPPARLGSARRSRGALRGGDGDVLPEPARRLRLPRRRGDGAGYARRHLDRAPRRRSSLPASASWSTRPTSMRSQRQSRA